jgi:hypothetical protein
MNTSSILFTTDQLGTLIEWLLPASSGLHVHQLMLAADKLTLLMASTHSEGFCCKNADVLVNSAVFQEQEMMREWGLHVDHTTIFRWVQCYAPELEKRCRPHLKATNDSWRVDETYIKIVRRIVGKDARSESCQDYRNILCASNWSLPQGLNPERERGV